MKITKKFSKITKIVIAIRQLAEKQSICIDRHESKNIGSCDDRNVHPTNSFSKGFGILEVLISSAVIIVVLGTLVFIARSAITNAQYMQERAQAIALAAEGIETVRQIRDTNYIDGNSLTKWNTITGVGSATLITYHISKASNARRNAIVENAAAAPVVFDPPYYINRDLLGGRLRIVNTLFPVPTINIAGVNYTRKIIFINIANTTASMTSPQLLTNPIDVSSAGNNGFEAMVEVTWSGSGGKAGRVELTELITNSRFVY